MRYEATETGGDHSTQGFGYQTAELGTSAGVLGSHGSTESRGGAGSSRELYVAWTERDKPEAGRPEESGG